MSDASDLFYLRLKWCSTCRFPSTWSKATCCGICGLLFQFLCQLHDSLILGPLLTLSDVIREGHAVVRTGLWLSVSVTKRCENNQGYLSISKCTVWSWCKNPRSRAWKIQPNLFFKTESTPAILRRIHKYHQIWWNICLWLSTCRSKKNKHLVTSETRVPSPDGFVPWSVWPLGTALRHPSAGPNLCSNRKNIHLDSISSIISIYISGYL